MERMGEQRHILRVVEGIRPRSRIVLAKGVSRLAAAWIAGRVWYSTVSESGYKRYIESLKRSGLNACDSTEKIEDSQDGIGGRGRAVCTAATCLRTAAHRRRH